MEILKNMDNSIEDNIQMEIEVLNTSSEGKMPVSDCQLWIDLVPVFMKAVRFTFTIRYRSIVSALVKRSTVLI